MKVVVESIVVGSGVAGGEDEARLGKAPPLFEAGHLLHQIYMPVKQKRDSDISVAGKNIDTILVRMAVDPC